MTNYERYKDDIERLGDGKVAFDKSKNKIVRCAVLFACEDCAFYANRDDCTLNAMKWAAEEYKEPEIDWSKVPIDTPVLVSDDGVNWERRYFVRKPAEAMFAVYSNGATSWSADGYVAWYRYAKLANEN
nr:MAG TPA: hypothetical protein [Caudoviricetes sp.]